MIISIPKELINIDTIIAHDEDIVCTNATIICKKDGEFSCWYDNNKPICTWVEENNNED